MSEQKLSGHTEELPGGGLRFIFDEPVILDSRGIIAMKITMKWVENFSPKKWTIKYDYDTGINDDYFIERWIITNGERDFTCRDEDNAKWLCALLNRRG